MTTSFTRFALSFLTLIGFAAVPSRAEDADPKKLGEQVEKLLEAYNKDDVKALFSDWAKSVEAITTEPVYDALYKNAAKKDLGNYTAKTVKLRKEGSVLSGDTLVVYFDAEFAKAKNGLISVNFSKEDG